MAKPAKRRIDGTDSAAGTDETSSTVKKPIQSVRVTPKGTVSQPRAPKNTQGDPREANERYAPVVKSGQELPSPPWVGALMFTLFGLGLLIIVLAYAEVLPGGASGWYLLGGLGCILGGIITSTQLR